MSLNVAILSTMADARRPAVTYRIEFESVEKLDEWLDTKWFLQETRRQWSLPDDRKEEGLNTVVTIFKGTKPPEVRRLQCRWDQILLLLEVADDLARDFSRSGSGRYPKRVLIATTSKERRLGKSYLY